MLLSAHVKMVNYERAHTEPGIQTIPYSSELEMTFPLWFTIELACVAGGIVFAREERAPNSKRLLPILRAAASLLPSQNFARANDPPGYAGYNRIATKN